MSGDGNCYEVAGKAAIDMRFGICEFPDFHICHGMVVGTKGPVKGRRFGHAWLESPDGQLVVDRSNGNNAVVRADLYYEVGQISEVKRYTPEEACRLMLETGVYGPWEE